MKLITSALLASVFFVVVTASSKVPFSLKNWILQLPTNGGQDKVLNPALSKGYSDKYFYLNPDKNGYIFSTPVVNPPKFIQTIPGHSFTRTELKEVIAGRKTGNRYFLLKKGTHLLKTTQAFTTISGARSTMIESIKIHTQTAAIYYVGLIGKDVVFYSVDAGVFTLEPNYVLGKKFTVQILVKKGVLTVSYNGAIKVTLNKLVSDPVYFRVGSYSENALTESGVQVNSVSAVTIYSLSSSHK